ncbi:glycosidase [bacterium]|nr:glycosidase [bacterium]
MREISSIEERLCEKAKQAQIELQGLREPKTDDIFTKRYYIGPEDIFIENYLRSKPIAAFNPGALIIGEKLFIFPRLIFDYYCYVSSIGEFSIDIEKVISGKIDKPLKTRINIWGDEPWEFGQGCEDPRVCMFNDNLYVLYTAVDKRDGKKDLQALAELDLSLKVKRKGFFSVINGKESCTPLMKDSAFIDVKDNKSVVLTRPSLDGINICWKAEADLEKMTINENSFMPVLSYEEWEHKVGWSTNTIKISADKYLVGWHAVLINDKSYRNGLAVVNGKGELLATSNYILTPQGLNESYGDRSFVIFGCGLIKYKEQLIWVGGMSDYSIGIFITEFHKALDTLKWIN